MFFNTCCNSCWNTWNQCRRNTCGCCGYGNSTNTTGTSGISNGATNAIFGYFVPVNVNQNTCQSSCRHYCCQNHSTTTMNVNGFDSYYARQYGLYPYNGSRNCGCNG